MGRGGQREGAGRKSGWNYSETQTIRVPKIFAAQILGYARNLDAGYDPDNGQALFDSETKSNLVPDVVPGQMDLLSIVGFEVQFDTETKSDTEPLRGDELAVRLRVNKGQPCKMKGRYKDNPQKFLQWTRGREEKIGIPVIGWLPNESTGLYHPVDNAVDDLASDF